MNKNLILKDNAKKITRKRLLDQYGIFNFFSKQVIQQRKKKLRKILNET